MSCRLRGCAVGAALILTSCGYIGPPQYPALNVPVMVTDVTAVERGDHLDVNFTIPKLTTEGLLVTSIGSVELRIGPGTPASKASDWAEHAAKIEVTAPERPETVDTKIPVRDFVGKEVLVGVRISNAKGRFSDWSNLFALQVTPPLATPEGLTAVDVPEGVDLKWTAPGEPSFHIFRKTDNDAQPSDLGTADHPEYLDRTTVYGQKYEYWVQGIDGKSESEPAGPVSITPKDKFPPAVPADLTATAGLNAIELAWRRNTEPDFQGYRVYRAIGNGPFERIADGIEAPNYSDRQVESGKRYRYAVSAVDQLGNESQQSGVVEATAP